MRTQYHPAGTADKTVIEAKGQITVRTSRHSPLILSPKATRLGESLSKDRRGDHMGSPARRRDPVRKMLLWLTAAALALATAAPVLANTGYEGQPGNQSADSGGGQQGYEGQPGNQGG